MNEDTTTIKPTQRGSGVLKDPEKRQKIIRQLNAGMDGMRHGLMKEEDRERQGDYSDGEETKPEPTFEGTNVPISLLFMFFAEGKNYKDLLANHPTVKEKDVLTVIEAARHTLNSEDFSVAKEMIALREDIERLNQNSATNFKKLADHIKEMFKLR